MKKIANWMRSNWVIIAAIIWVVVGVILFLDTLRATAWKFNWSVLGGFATWILAGGVGVAIWQISVTRENTSKQLEATRKSTNAQIAVELFRELRSPQSKKTLGLIYRLASDDTSLENSYTRSTIISKRIRDEINDLLDKFEMLGSLVNHGIIDKSLAIEAFGGVPALRSWYCLVDYIRKEEQCYRGYFLPNYEAFVRLCLNHFHKESVKVKRFKEDTGGKRQEVPPELVSFFNGLKRGNSRYPRSLEEIKDDRQKNNKEKT